LLAGESTNPTTVTAPSRPVEAAQRPTLRSLPLERKLPLLVLALLTVVLGTSLLFSYYEIRAAAETSASARLNSLSQVIASTVQQPLAARLANMHRAARDTSVISALSAPSRALTKAAATSLSALNTPADSLTPARLLGMDGQPIGNVRLETPADIERVRSELRALPASDTAHVGSWYTANGHASFWMAIPVRRNGQVIGYVAQERRLNSNPRALQPFRDLIGSDVQLYFRNVDGSAWIDLSGARVRAPASIKPLSGRFAEVTDSGHARALASSALVSGTPFFVTVEYAEQRLLAGPQATIRTLSVIAVVLVVLGAAIAWFISRQMTRPLVELTSAAEAIAEGEYSQRVGARGSDEIGRLANAFNRMATQVQVSSKASEKAVVRLTHSAARQEFLAEASRILAESLSDETLLADLARYCVPALADYCSIYVVDDDGSMRRVETAHVDPAKRDAVVTLIRRYEESSAPRLFVSDVIQSQKPLLYPRLDPAALRANAPDDTARRLLDEIGPRAFMCVPLIARGRALGAMSFTMTDSGRTFAQDELDLAMEMARRTAVAIDNAMIYRRSLSLRLEAEAASSAKSDFLAKMSHEIRTPINAMMGYAELLEMGISGPVSEAQTKHLARIRASGEHLTSLVNEILDLAKIEAGRMDVEPVVGSTGEAVDAALGLIRPQAAAKGVQLIARTDDSSTAEYLGDPQRVQQILTNLLANAVKFTPTGGTVSVRVATARRATATAADAAHVAEWACIEVRDTGIGIGDGDLERIFQPFVQVDNGYTRTHGGTGLGLTISRSLAHMMGGELTVDSVVGKGSRFTLWLPSPASAAVQSVG
jgi:signal transduction histidine kinase